MCAMPSHLIPSNQQKTIIRCCSCYWHCYSRIPLSSLQSCLFYFILFVAVLNCVCSCIYWLILLRFSHRLGNYRKHISMRKTFQYTKQKMYDDKAGNRVPARTTQNHQFQNERIKTETIPFPLVCFCMHVSYIASCLPPYHRRTIAIAIILNGARASVSSLGDASANCLHAQNASQPNLNGINTMSLCVG